MTSGIPDSDIVFARSRAKKQQLGSQHSHENEYGKMPRTAKIREYQYVASHDTTVNAILNIFSSTLLSLLGPIEHPDPEIDDYLKYNSKRLTEEVGVDIYQAMGDAIYSALSTGLSCSENLFDVINGKILIRDFVHYDPKSILIRTNRKGRLTEGESSFAGGLKSGVYQSGHFLSQLSPSPAEIPLSLWKINLLQHNKRYGNYYGVSAIEPIYKWTLSTDAVADMMLVALDRFGTPITAISVPVQLTDEVDQDAEGNEVQLNSLQSLQKQIEEQDVKGGNVILLPIYTSDRKPDIKTLTTGNNIGSTFTDAISFCDLQKARGLLMPFSLLGASKNYATDNESQSERQMEIFNRVVSTIYNELIVPMVSQSWHRLIRMAFNRESAKTPPCFPLRRTSRPEAQVALMQLISGMAEKGFLNPTNADDWTMVRDWISANKREQDANDVSFIKDILINPRNPEEGGAGKDGKKKKPTKKGKGAQGRPPGTSAPQNKTRPLKAADIGSVSQTVLLTEESETQT